MRERAGQIGGSVKVRCGGWLGRPRARLRARAMVKTQCVRTHGGGAARCRQRLLQCHLLRLSRAPRKASPFPPRRARNVTYAQPDYKSLTALDPELAHWKVGDSCASRLALGAHACGDQPACPVLDVVEAHRKLRGKLALVFGARRNGDKLRASRDECGLRGSRGGLRGGSGHTCVLPFSSFFRKKHMPGSAAGRLPFHLMNPSTYSVSARVSSSD